MRPSMVNYETHSVPSFESLTMQGCRKVTRLGQKNAQHHIF